jgi:hypothetical protein
MKSIDKENSNFFKKDETNKNIKPPRSTRSNSMAKSISTSSHYNLARESEAQLTTVSTTTVSATKRRNTCCTIEDTAASTDLG